MSRRLLALFCVLVAVMSGAATIALASGGRGHHSATTAGATTTAAATTTSATAPTANPQAAGGHGFGMFRMIRQVVLKSLAGRLGVTPDALQAAVKKVGMDQFTAKAKQAGLTDAEVAALKACHHHGGLRMHRSRQASGACDMDAVRSAITKLKALPKPDLAALKTQLSQALGTALGVDASKVVDAVRAELEERLGQAVAMGFLPADAKTKVLACYDDPATCDVDALRQELHPGFGMRHGGVTGRWHHR